jgi:hypothetical protein
MQKGNFEDIKGVIGSRKSKDIRYNDQIQKISSKYSTTTENKNKLYSNGKWYLPLLTIEIIFDERFEMKCLIIVFLD